MVILIVTEIHIIYIVHKWQTCFAFTLPSRFTISTLVRFFSSSGTIFHALDAKCRKEVKPK